MASVDVSGATADIASVAGPIAACAVAVLLIVVGLKALKWIERSLGGASPSAEWLHSPEHAAYMAESERAWDAIRTEEATIRTEAAADAAAERLAWADTVPVASWHNPAAEGEFVPITDEEAREDGYADAAEYYADMHAKEERKAFDFESREY